MGLRPNPSVEATRNGTAEGQLESRLVVMQELVALDVDVIVTGGPGVTAAQRATDRIPIVALVEGPLSGGLIESLARPGRNVTGFGSNFPGLYGKQLQLLKEAVPTISRVAVIATTQRRRCGGGPLACYVRSHHARAAKV